MQHLTDSSCSAAFTTAQPQSQHPLHSNWIPGKPDVSLPSVPLAEIWGAHGFSSQLGIPQMMMGWRSPLHIFILIIAWDQPGAVLASAVWWQLCCPWMGGQVPSSPPLKAGQESQHLREVFVQRTPPQLSHYPQGLNAAQHLVFPPCSCGQPVSWHPWHRWGRSTLVCLFAGTPACKKKLWTQGHICFSGLFTLN